MTTWQALDASFAPLPGIFRREIRPPLAQATPIGRRGRDYCLAFLALADALAAEPPTSVLALSLDEQRKDAVLVAAGSAVIGAQLAETGQLDRVTLRLVDRAIRSIDARLAGVPLRVTTYRGARDQLRAALQSPSPCGVSGGAIALVMEPDSY
jgi:hypothetical protein